MENKKTIHKFTNNNSNYYTSHKNSTNKEHSYILAFEGRFFTDNNSLKLLYFSWQQLNKQLKKEAKIFLGENDEKLFFIYNIKSKEHLPAESGGTFSDLRFMAANLTIDEAHMTAKAAALINWHKINNLCIKCGSETRQNNDGNIRQCNNKICSYQIFPRLYPAIIVLVTFQDKCLLGRQKKWPDNQFSTIAGFVEPAESLENAVAREVFEETNIMISKIKYHSSQPWPFPSSLMLGFNATATTKEIKLNDNELEQAAWFSKEDLLSGVCKLPPPLSISRALINDWINKAK